MCCRSGARFLRNSRSNSSAGAVLQKGGMAKALPTIAAAAGESSSASARLPTLLPDFSTAAAAAAATAAVVDLLETPMELSQSNVPSGIGGSTSLSFSISSSSATSSASAASFASAPKDVNQLAPPPSPIGAGVSSKVNSLPSSSRTGRSDSCRRGPPRKTWAKKGLTAAMPSEDRPTGASCCLRFRPAASAGEEEDCAFDEELAGAAPAAALATGSKRPTSSPMPRPRLPAPPRKPPAPSLSSAAPAGTPRPRPPRPGAPRPSMVLPKQ
mmetsp:Transcript_76122/g.218102  ORF Transcript_76122/g.218102 Transcript_76122/m.218102 type:complete len:270 (+) Transcript_76122:192-1001(+)